MPSTNVELVRSIVAPWAHGDYRSYAWADPDIVWEVADGPAPTRWTGIGGMIEGWTEFLSLWEDHRTEATELRELDDVRVLALFHIHARGKSSGVDKRDTDQDASSRARRAPRRESDALRDLVRSRPAAW